MPRYFVTKTDTVVLAVLLKSCRSPEKWTWHLSEMSVSVSWIFGFHQYAVFHVSAKDRRKIWQGCWEEHWQKNRALEVNIRVEPFTNPDKIRTRGLSMFVKMFFPLLAPVDEKMLMSWMSWKNLFSNSTPTPAPAQPKGWTGVGAGFGMMRSGGDALQWKWKWNLNF